MKPSLKGTLPALPPIVVDRKVAAARSVGWRTTDHADLRRRRRIVGSYALASLAMGAASLYQTGIVRRVPELPFPRFDANYVEASAEGYQVLGVPDAVLAVFSNASTMLLATLGGPGPRSAPLRALLAAKVTVDSAYVGKLVFDQVARHKVLCTYCLVASAATFGALAPAWRQAT